jgi:hypothetical protein
LASGTPGVASSVAVGWNTAGDGATVDATGRTPALPLGPFGLRLVTRAAGASDGRGDHRYQIRTQAQMEWAASRAGGALGIASEQRQRADQLPTRPVFEGLAWVRRGDITLTGGVQHQAMRVPQSSLWITQWPPPLPGTWPSSFQPYSSQLPFALARDARLVRLTALESAVRWSRGRWELAATGGLAAGEGIAPVRLARADVAWRLRPGMAVTAAAVAGAPHWLTLDLSERPHVQLGLRFEPGDAPAAGAAPAASEPPPGWEWRVLPRGDGTVALRLRAPGVRTAEVRGDFTGWLPLALRPAPDGWWETALPIPRGVHGVELRTDAGRWIVPPGTPAGAGVFGGRVGTLVIE